MSRSVSVVLRQRRYVYIAVTIGEKTKTYPTKVKVEDANHFNKKTTNQKWISKKVKDHDEQNKTIKEKLDEITEATAGIKTYEELKAASKKKVEEPQVEEPQTFSEQYAWYLEMHPDLKRSTLQAKRRAIAHWQEYVQARKKKDIIDDIDYDALKVWLSRKFATATVFKTLKDVKACILYLKKKKKLKTEQIERLSLEDWVVEKQRPQNIYYLSGEELKHLDTYPFQSERLRRTRDKFILQCHTGVRVSDLDTLKVQGDLIVMKAQKTDSLLSIPLTSRAKQILEAYEGKAPALSSVKYNAYLKEAARDAGLDREVSVKRDIYQKWTGERLELVEQWHRENGLAFINLPEKIPVPLWSIVSTHMAVRSFITLASEAGIPIKTIAEITGKTVKVIMENYLGSTIKTLKTEMAKFDQAFG